MLGDEELMQFCYYYRDIPANFNVVDPKLQRFIGGKSASQVIIIDWFQCREFYYGNVYSRGNLQSHIGTYESKDTEIFP